MSSTQGLLGAQATLGFIGVGAMGQGMCRNLAAKSGRRVVACDLSADNLARIAEHGVTAMTLAELRRNTQAVFLSLPSIAEVEEVCFGAEPLAAPDSTIRLIVDMSTSDVGRTRALARRLAEAGIAFLDAPVARSREAAEKGTLLITVGGSTETFAQTEPLLRCMGSDVIHCGDTGAGQIVKIMNNMVLLSTVGALAEAMAIAEAAGVDKPMLARVLGLGSANSFALQLTGERFLARNEFPEKLFPAAYALKDVRLALSLARDFRITPPVASATAELLGHAVDQGYGANYYPVVYRTLMPA